MEIIRILQIDDAPDELNSFKISVELFNRRNEDINIELFQRQNAKDLDSLTNRNEIDTIIIDLKFGGKDINGEGNEIVKHIHMKKRIPIIIYSGNLNVLSDEINEIRKSDVFKVYEKTSIKHTELINSIVEIHKSGYLKIFRHPGLIDNLLDEIFWKYAGNNLNVWCKYENEIERNNKFMRYVTSRMANYLQYSDGISDTYHPIELYIHPTIITDLFPGKIIKYNSEDYVVMNPACELLQNKATDIILCKINHEKYENFCNKIRKEIKNSSELSKRKKAEIQDVLHHKKSDEHFLPKTTFISGGFLEFSTPLIMEKEKLNAEQYEIRGEISKEFMNDISIRFVRFIEANQSHILFGQIERFKKIGEPDLVYEVIIDDIFE